MTGMNHARHTEGAFETVIESVLLANGYVSHTPESFDRPTALFPQPVLDFIQATQPKEWKALEALHGEKTGAQVLADLVKWIDANGSLSTLRHGFKCYGKTLRVATFKAAYEDPVQLLYASSIVLSAGVLLIGWGLFIRLNRYAEELEPEAMAQAKSEDRKFN